MTTSPNTLDILDSHIGSADAEEYNSKLKQFESTVASYWKFEVVPRIFQQSLDETDESKFNYLDNHFGILQSWDSIIEKLNQMNASGNPEESYKLVFLARHGQGFHNLAHTKYGNKAWNEHWSKLNGDGQIVWGPDPNLTELGISQAKENGAVWRSELANNVSGNTKLILPSKWFVSPLSRSIDTLINTWKDIVDLQKVNPLIQENLRETTGIHTCDKRSSKRVIAEKYESKGLVIEQGLEEEDIYYKDDYRETVAEHSLRINKNFQQIFSEYPQDSILSFTSHSGSIRAQLLALGHRSFAVGTGGMIPVFVKATKQHNKL